MRPVEELERIAFREPLTTEEDARLAELFAGRAAAGGAARQHAGAMKQAAFFGARAFDKGERDPAALSRFAELLAEAQRLAPSESFRRKLAEVKSVAAGKDAYAAAIKRLARAGEPGRKSVLANDAELDSIEAELGVTLPRSYRAYLKQAAHRQIGTYEPYTAGELAGAAREAWDGGLEPHLLPFLDDNADHFCFDLRSTVAEPPVVYRPHDGTSDETWPNFAAWIDECWLAELED
ncbi:MAG TPA: SMI1/KNR4 family protein [Chthonomonadaceae bacterium]|nr:SMI1/KNR4 family protein [Chthonomonadaceae bacterium]